jgi:hypothetical protein
MAMASLGTWPGADGEAQLQPEETKSKRQSNLLPFIQTSFVQSVFVLK